MNDLVNMKVERSVRDRIKESKGEGQTYSEVLDDRLNKVSSGAGKEGIAYISSTGSIFEAPALSLKELAQMAENPYIASKLNANSTLFFPSALKVEVKDPSGLLNEEITADVKRMMGVLGCSISEKMKQAEYDTRVYGISCFNPVWELVDGVDKLVAIRHLPAWSFQRSPAGADKIYSILLQGITLNNDGEVEYWQTQENGDPVKIENIMSVKNPRDEGLAGDSKISSLYDIINMLKFGWNVEMQALARAGAPIFFLKITKPKKATDPGTGGVSDIALGNSIIRNWSTSKQHLLRENMEVISLPLEQTVDPLNATDRLEKVINNYFSLTFELKKEGSTIGGSDLSELKLLNRQIQGLHAWLIPPFEDLVNQYFIRNMFPEGWSCSLSYDVWETDDRDIKIRQVQTAAQYNALDLNDIRTHLDFEQADEEKTAAILAFNKSSSSMRFATGLGLGQQNIGQSQNGNAPTAQADQAGALELEKQTGSNSILNKVPGSDLDDLSTELYKSLSGDLTNLFAALSKVLDK